MGENIAKQMDDVKAEIHENNIKFAQFKKFTNLFLEEMDKINTTNRNLYAKLGELSQKLEG